LLAKNIQEFSPHPQCLLSLAQKSVQHVNQGEKMKFFFTTEQHLENLDCWGMNVEGTSERVNVFTTTTFTQQIVSATAFEHHFSCCSLLVFQHIQSQIKRVT
jgi:hypothetical protein